MATEIWGDVPGWVEALGTSGAFMVTATVLWRDRRAKDREYADNVSRWLVNGDSGIQLFVANFCKAPAYNVSVVLVYKNFEADFFYRTIPPSSERLNDPAIDAKLRILIRDCEEKVQVELRRAGQVHLERELIFTDPSGQRWSRWNDGTLHKVAPHLRAVPRLNAREVD